MKRTPINPESAEGYLFRARRILSSLDESTHASARCRAQEILPGLFSMVGSELALTDQEQLDLATFECITAGPDMGSHVCHRTKQAILNLSIARVFAGARPRRKEAAA